VVAARDHQRQQERQTAAAPGVQPGSTWPTSQENTR
jgi:hypothetical protein